VDDDDVLCWPIDMTLANPMLVRKEEEELSLEEDPEVCDG
jgi:hypothetical protein